MYHNRMVRNGNYILYNLLIGILYVSCIYIHKKIYNTGLNYM